MASSPSSKAESAKAKSSNAASTQAEPVDDLTDRDRPSDHFDAPAPSTPIVQPKLGIVGYLFVGTRLACYGVVGIDLPALRLRTLTEAAAAAYPADPTRQLTMDELKNR